MRISNLFAEDESNLFGYGVVKLQFSERHAILKATAYVKFIITLQWELET